MLQYVDGSKCVRKVGALGNENIVQNRGSKPLKHSIVERILVFKL